ncbi:MAG: YHS domain-containing protein [Chloroflexi bacterium]|nr:YHS domain-containing protein [Chloroflexota bacterium]MBI4315872.1 YHS domain-containing protein [Chloroflexota bacterium]
MKKKRTSTLRVVTDPVCKMELCANQAAATLKFNGRQYYFCHAACLRLFEADPLAYVDEAQADDPARSADSR